MQPDSTNSGILSNAIRNGDELGQSSEEMMAAIGTKKCAVADERISSIEAPIPDSELDVIAITRDDAASHCNHILRLEECWQRGEKVNGVVMQSRHAVREHVSCMLAHDLLNKVTAIVGFCELLASDQTDSQKEIHLHRLRVTALLIADMLNERSCRLAFCSSGPQELLEKSLDKTLPPEDVPAKVYESNDTYVVTQHLIEEC